VGHATDDRDVIVEAVPSGHFTEPPTKPISAPAVAGGQPGRSPAPPLRARNEWGRVDARVESDRVVTRENGELLHPDWLSRRFMRLVELSGLHPVRLHDLRHISASPSLLQGNDIWAVQQRLGHSSRQTTSDTYTIVLPELARVKPSPRSRRVDSLNDQCTEDRRASFMLIRSLIDCTAITSREERTPWAPPGTDEAKKAKEDRKTGHKAA
jgi:hypothetical protein